MYLVACFYPLTTFNNMVIVMKFPLNPVVLAALVLLAPGSLLADSAPDFAAIKDTKQKKAAFFGFMHPFIVKANAKVMAERNSILELQSAIKKDEPLTNEKLVNLCEKYSATCDKKSTIKSIQALLPSVDTVPASLALAQSANESAWGTSRFARKANNFFGQWCYKKGCGLVPKRRNAGSKHEVRKFNSAYGSVKSYIFNLNTGHAYKKLRNIRQKMRAKGLQPTGLKMAEGLTSYSERKHEYVKEIQSMIRYNKLQKYDQKPANLNKK